MRHRDDRPDTGPSAGGQGRFTGFDVLSQAATWDPVTAGVVLRRLGPPPPLRFFTPPEEAIASALLDHLLDQWDDPKIPVLAMIDERLTEGTTDGWHYADLPPDEQAWRDSLAALDRAATERHDHGFADCTRAEQAAIIQDVQDAGDGTWAGAPAARVWSLWTRYATTAFYAHPWAWNEIGFGGPAYPRGYKNIGLDKREPWETSERDAHDPIPWAERVEAARRRHLHADGDPSDVGAGKA
jgi:Gluconate 2-dehydrogenase subunit 3